MWDPTYPLVPVINIFSACLLVATIVSNNIRGARNRGVIMLQGWILVQVIIMAIQSIVWGDSSEIIAPIFCDISSHLWQGLTIGIPTCSFIITRRIWLAIQGNSTLNCHETRKEMSIDYFFGLGVPFMSMGLYYIVQGVRFQVTENYGCSTYIYECGLAIILLQCWILVFPFLSLSLYGWRIMLYLYRHKRTAVRLLQRNGIRLNHAHYTRTFLLACIDVVLVMPLGAVNIAAAVSDGVAPFWPGWSRIHSGWAPCTVTSAQWRESTLWSFNLYWNQCSGVPLSVAIFLLFGLTRGTKGTYKATDERARNGTLLFRTAQDFISAVVSTPAKTLPGDQTEVQTPLPFVDIARLDLEQAGDLRTLHSTVDADCSTSVITIDIEGVDISLRATIPHSDVRPSTVSQGEEC